MIDVIVEEIEVEVTKYRRTKLEYRGTDCLVSGAVEVSVWVDSGIVDVGAGSAGLFCEC